MDRNHTPTSLLRSFDALCAAHDEALKLAAQLYPAGTRVGVMLSSTQKRPSPATLGTPSIHTWKFGSAPTGGTVEFGVRLDHAKDARSAVRRVSLDAIRPIEDC